MAAADALKKGVPVANGLFVLRVSKDGLEARIKAADSKIGASLSDVDLDALLDEVRKQGIIFGVLKQPRQQGPGIYTVAACSYRQPV